MLQLSRSCRMEILLPEALGLLETCELYDGLVASLLAAPCRRALRRTMRLEAEILQYSTWCTSTARTDSEYSYY